LDFRGLLKHTLIYGSGVWAGKLIGFVMIPVYTRVLKPSDYGVLEMITRATDAIGLVLGMGLAAALIRFHAEGKSDKERARVINTAIAFAGGIGLAAAIVLGASSNAIAGLMFSSARYALCVRLALIAMGMELCTVAPLALLRIHERSGLFAALGVGRLVVALSLNVYLVVILRMGVLGLMISNLIGVSFVMAVLVVAVGRSWRPALDSRLLRAMLAYSLPLVPCSFAMFVLNFGDRFFLRACCGLDVLGVYSLGYKLCMVMPGLVMEPIGLAWSAVVFTLADRDDARRIYARYFNGFTFCVVFFGLWLSAISRDVIRVMADRSYWDAYRIVPVVMLGLCAWGASNVFETGILVSKRTYYRTIGHLMSAAIVAAAYLLLIPRFGQMGAAWATVVGFTAMATATYSFSQRVYRIPYDLRRGLLLLGIACGLYAISRLLPGVGLALIAPRTLIVLALPVILYELGYFGQEDISAARGVARSVLHRAAAAVGRACPDSTA
jgi:O-antigen/teichoic acid export membrane protein